MRLIIFTAAYVAALLALSTCVSHARPARHHLTTVQSQTDDRYFTSRTAPARDGHRTPRVSSGGGGNLVGEMRRYVGSNPTGWARVWCGVFLDMVLRRTGHAPGSALARAYAGYGRPAAGPAPGTIAVWRHHVGVVTAVAGRTLTLISGNDGRRVRERPRSAAGVIAYRWP